ncbi:tyrosine-type recombinase/integrase [Polynucleobacter paludilacus]|uniref:tyrosine-type recombinase/integrase n=1 Tax=Polynucleobacter paludilacus TaxID=1855895 RepID=UPI001BFD4160|nr:tyrosine-type recombinase/integrase [Polynucleobacter paludilacus]QWD87336.1 tyrosine-type recombinase/integrase [Polynucleobacter paludilacus]
MLINQDFAQSEPKSPVKRRLELVGNFNQVSGKEIAVSDLDRATKLLQETIIKIEGAYAPATIRAYRADFNDFIRFCDTRHANALPAEPNLVVQYISQLTGSSRSSASIRRALCGLSAIHKLNRFDDPTKDPDVALEMRRMHRKLGRSSSQAGSINANTLEKLLLATDDSIRGIRDRTLLLVAYDTLCRRSELVSLQVKDVKFNIKNGIETSSILLRKSKTDQDSTGKWLHLSQRAHLALVEWVKELPEGQEMLFCGLNRALDFSANIGAGQINRIYKRIARKAGLSELEIKGISGHSMRVGAAQDLLNSGASMPIIMQRGRWSKTDTVMRYVENGNPMA